MQLQEWQWAVVGLAAFMAGMAKTGIAGLGILAVALFATVLPARESVGILLVVLVAADIVAVAVYRREASWPHLLRLFPWAGVGVLLGAAAFGRMDDGMVRGVIGAILMALVLLHLWRRYARPAAEEWTPRRWVVALTGLTAGFTTMVANAAGPLMVIYLLAMRLPKLTFVGTAAWFFLVLNLSKLPFSAALGLLHPAALGVSLRLLPFAVAGALSGRWLIAYLDQRLFEALALLLTFVAALRLLLA
jgi:uncharacterized membrane protein YfcA